MKTCFVMSHILKVYPMNMNYIRSPIYSTAILVTRMQVSCAE